MRWNTQSGKVVSSHSSACGASSLRAKLLIDSRSCSCSSLKMKWRRFDEAKSGLMTVSVDMRGTVADGARKVNSGTAYFLLRAALVATEVHRPDRHAATVPAAGRVAGTGEAEVAVED